MQITKLDSQFRVDSQLISRVGARKRPNHHPGLILRLNIEAYIYAVLKTEMSPTSSPGFTM